VVALIVYCFINNGPLYADESIRWAVLDFPPFHIVDGEFKGKGIADGVMWLLQENLKEYKHDIFQGNAKRVLFEMQRGENVCNATMIKNPKREALFIFSLPSIIHPANRIIIKQENFKKFGNKKELQLRTLLSNTQIKCGIHKGRSYGPQIDEILKESMNNSNIYAGSTSNLSYSCLQMLARGRIDFFIDFISNVNYLQRIHDIQGKFISIGIKEAPQYVLSHVACSKGETGYQIISKVNKILGEQRVQKKYQKILESWLDKNSINLIQHNYQRNFLERKYDD
jgi:uncharacterized protein (TIGR02285 family)